MVENSSVLSIGVELFQLFIERCTLKPVESFLDAAVRRSSKHCSLISETQRSPIAFPNSTIILFYLQHVHRVQQEKASCSEWNLGSSFSVRSDRFLLIFNTPMKDTNLNVGDWLPLPEQARFLWENVFLLK